MSDLHLRILPIELKPLADKFYRSHRAAMRPSPRDRVWVAQRQDIIAAVCLRPVACGYWLTGLFVAPRLRRQGLARQLIEQALAKIEGPTWLFCHPQLHRFYQRLGFDACDSLPPELHERLMRYQRNKTLIALVHDGGAGTHAGP
jgi:GNAT superfamily N-acetyltransferase